MDTDYAAIGRRIKQLRTQQHMTQVDMSKAIGLSTSYVGHIERGTRIPSLETTLRIASIFDITVDELLTGTPSVSGGHGIAPNEMRMLNNIMRVLHKYSAEWLCGDHM